MTVRSAARPAAAWSPNQVFASMLLSGLGVLVIAIGWMGISGEVRVEDQWAWMNVSVGGLILTGMVNGSWLFVGRKMVTHRRTRLDQQLRELTSDIAPRERTAPMPDDALVAIAGTSRFHRTRCILVESKSPIAASRLEHERAERQPCEICDP